MLGSATLGQRRVPPRTASGALALLPGHAFGPWLPWTLPDFRDAPVICAVGLPLVGSLPCVTAVSHVTAQ